MNERKKVIKISIGERIKTLRTQLGLNQTDFGASIGLAQTSVAAYEVGRRMPLEAVILNICRQYNVSEKWLRTGEGAMQAPQGRQEEIAAFVGKTLTAPDNIRFKVLSILSRMTADDWDRLAELAEELYKNQTDE